MLTRALGMGPGTMALGMFSGTVLILSVCFLCLKKPFWSLVCNMAIVVLVCWTGYGWKLMLISSGKDTTLLGFYRYPAALIILAILLLSALILMIVSTSVIVRKRKSKS